MPRMRWATWVLVLLPWPFTPTARAGDAPASSDVYVRGSYDLPKTLERVLTDSTLSTVAAVVVAFEAASFAPPPGRTEFTAFYGFHQDIPAWSRALAEAGKTNAHYRLFACSSQQRDLLDMQAPKAEALLKATLERPWAKDPKGKPFEPAAQWMADAVKAARKRTKAERVALVYVADRVLPERSFEYAQNQEHERAWRQRLLPEGAYFDEEAVGRKLQELKCVLVVVAPEAHFEDFTPVAELPGIPWAARPEIISGLGSLPDLDLGMPEEAPEGGPGDLLSEEEIEKILDSLPPGTPEEVREAMREMLKGSRRGGGAGKMPPGEPPFGGEAPPQPAPEAPDEEPPADLPPEITGPDLPEGFPPVPLPPRVGGEGRFSATTPTWFPRLGMRTPWCNHTPSGFGHWPFARAAGLTGGRYLFYPFPPGKWLDVCPTAPPQLADLAPELVKRAEFARLGSGDPAWDALDTALRAVHEQTPWDDDSFGGCWASGWGSFVGRRPLVAEKRWSARRKPRDLASGVGRQGGGELERIGAELLAETVPAYDRAIRALDERIAELRAPQPPKAHPRALADLTLGRFWLSMSRFHLHAFGIYAKEIERFKPDDPKLPVGSYVITYVPTIRMSDVLEGYEPRELDAAGEKRFRRSVIPGVKHQQGNLLEIPLKDPLFRARRELDRVLLHLDERLKPHAIDMIESARRVMERYARTPWGWTTYYTVAYTFVWHPVPPEKGMTGPMGPVGPTPPSEEPAAPVTPGGGGSSGGGPATGGR